MTEPKINYLGGYRTMEKTKEQQVEELERKASFHFYNWQFCEQYKTYDINDHEFKFKRCQEKAKKLKDEIKQEMCCGFGECGCEKCVNSRELIQRLNVIIGEEK